MMLTKKKRVCHVDQSKRANILDLQKYYTMPQITPTKGTCELRTISSAQHFLYQHFQPNIKDLSQQNEQGIQYSLWSLCHVSQAPTRAQAALTLRCFIVNTAKISIDSLVNKCAPQLGQARQYILRQDLYPCVIDDDGHPINVLPKQTDQSLAFDFRDRQAVESDDDMNSPSCYKAFSLKVLSTYDPKRVQGENLKNWTHRLVKQNKEIKNVLYEYGIHFTNPWQFLSRIKPLQLKQIEIQFSSLSYSTIEEHVKILTALRLINQERRRRNQANKATLSIQNNSLTKVDALRLHLEKDQILFSNATELQTKLKEIMVILLQHKAKVNQPETKHVPHEDTAKHIDFTQLLQDTAPTGFDSITAQAILSFQTKIQEQFHPLYQRHRLSFLDTSIQKTVQQRQAFLAKRSKERPKNYILALRLFFCEGLSMTEIASKLQLSSQGQVSRLLALSSNPSNQLSASPNLMNSCLLQMAQELRKQFQVWSHTYATADEQKLLIEESSLLWTLLDGQIQDIIHIFQEARAEISHPKRARISLFAQRIGNLLNTSI